MKRVAWRASLVAVLGLGLASQGCLVPWSKYLKLKRQYDQAARDLAEKESILGDLNTRLEDLRNQITAKDQLIKLYEDKYKDAQLIASRAKEDMDKLQARINEVASRIGAEAGPRKIMLKDTLLFETGKAVISAEGQRALGDLAREFQATGEAFQIDGHTDDQRVVKPETIREHKDNWGLSANRALAVLRFLAHSGIAENRMYICAFSMHRPRAANDSDANRGKNRRVELMFLPGAGAGAATPPPPAPEPPTPPATPAAPAAVAPAGPTPAGPGAPAPER